MKKATDEDLQKAIEREYPNLNRRERRLLKYKPEALKHFMVPGPKHYEASTKLAAPQLGNAWTGTDNGVVH